MCATAPTAGGVDRFRVGASRGATGCNGRRVRREGHHHYRAGSGPPSAQRVTQRYLRARRVLSLATAIIHSGGPLHRSAALVRSLRLLYNPHIGWLQKFPALPRNRDVATARRRRHLSASVIAPPRPPPAPEDHWTRARLWLCSTIGCLKHAVHPHERLASSPHVLVAIDRRAPARRSTDHAARGADCAQRHSCCTPRSWATGTQPTPMRCSAPDRHAPLGQTAAPAAGADSICADRRSRRQNRRIPGNTSSIRSSSANAAATARRASFSATCAESHRPAPHRHGHASLMRRLTARPPLWRIAHENPAVDCRPFYSRYRPCPCPRGPWRWAACKSRRPRS